MKANWKIALMCVATLAFVACEKKNGPVDPTDPTTDFKSKVSVTDKSIAEWDNLPAEYVVSAECPQGASMLGLKNMKVYADQLYINLLFEYDEKTFGAAPADVQFHLYINTDNNDATGGYSDEFLDPNADVLLEGALFGENGEVEQYNPSVAKWWGEPGGAGWEWQDPNGANDESDCWGALVCGGSMPVGNSQLVNGKIEMQIMRAMIPCKDFAPWDADQFGLGVDIQQSWSTMGILPQQTPTEDNAGGLAKKLVIKIDKSK